LNLKAGLAPAFLMPAACWLLLTAAAIRFLFRRCAEQSVDGFHAALEIDSRSSYVPSSIIWRLIAFRRRACSRVFARPEMPTWMKS
jgi:hypothetical protein